MRASARVRRKWRFRTVSTDSPLLQGLTGGVIFPIKRAQIQESTDSCEPGRGRVHHAPLLSFQQRKALNRRRVPMHWRKCRLYRVGDRGSDLGPRSSAARAAGEKSRSSQPRGTEDGVRRYACFTTLEGSSPSDRHSRRREAATSDVYLAIHGNVRNGRQCCPHAHDLANA